MVAVVVVFVVVVVPSHAVTKLFNGTFAENKK